MSSSADYWRRREEAQRAHNITDEREYAREINRIYESMLSSIEEQINSFYAKYASAEGITMAEARKRAASLDIERYARKAKRYVDERNFSAKANEEMRLYNLTMKVNRLELLKANIGLELVSGHDELESFMEEKIGDATEDELRRQAGILGKTVINNAKTAHVIVNASFHNATFSDRIWMHQDLLRNEINSLIQVGLIQGKNPRVLARELRRKFKVKKSDAERLMRTEMARARTDAQMREYEENGFGEYKYIACGGSDVCDVCKKMDGKVFSVKKIMPGVNAPPMHPNCHCSTAPYIDEKKYYEWLDSYDQHHMSYNDWVDRKELISGNNFNSHSNGEFIKAENNNAKSFRSLLADVKKLYFEQDISQLNKIEDNARYEIARLPVSDKNILLDGSNVIIEGKSLKRILNKHGREFSLDEFALIREAIAKPDCIALNDSHHKNSLLMYKSIKKSKKSVMECVFVKSDKNIIIHYHKINKRKIRKLMKENKIIENKL
ncbi:minor capsid protein [Sharpea azabuensis]|uniref:minor capsid protein n=1 Tax=Sharpea azabuensis TaxID=322505 RepID=UPI002409330E|nr:minor capsid protein [Sharpea azabuensis]MDD6512790.1 minor capsid protein [Sharpea azabuensis]